MFFMLEIQSGKSEQDQFLGQILRNHQVNFVFRISQELSGVDSKKESQK